MKRTVLLACLAISPRLAIAQAPVFSHADSIRGSNTPERAWWDLLFNDLHVRVSPADSSISGVNTMTYRVTGPAREMQVDLRQPLMVDSIVQNGARVTARRDSNALYLSLPSAQAMNSTGMVAVYYHGRPRVALQAPWDGGFVWTRDSLGNPWIATAVQGLGASAWWPGKDYQADEPDSQRVAITMPAGITDVSNGRLRSTTVNADGTTTYEWFVTNPVNNYGISLNAGTYAHFTDLYAGESGPLTLDFWPLAYHEDAAHRQFAQVKPMMACFERWFGPYPWYADGYKLVETPHLGMEHQSAVAYGNHYGNGYLGRDLSGTGLGMTWDYIIIHESAHEWWGNSLTTADIADMWVHEAFAMYSEGIYVECQSGPAAGATYIRGVRRGIQNDRPIVGTYGVQHEGSGDMYYKGANMLLTIRQIVNDDARWMQTLRGLQSQFRHQIVTGQQVQDYISRSTGVDLSRVFAQYLTTTKVPVLEYSFTGNTLSYRWANVVPGFDMPVRTTVGGTVRQLSPTTTWQRLEGVSSPLALDVNYYATAKEVKP